MTMLRLSAAGAVVLLGTVLTACSPAQSPADSSSDQSPSGTNSVNQFPRLKALDIPAPSVPARPAQVNYHGQSIEDPYQWLRDESYPDTDDKEVLDYLHAENDYFNAFLAPHSELVDTLFEEFKGRLDETETSVPFVKNGYEYRWKYRAGNEYVTRIRKNLETGEESVFLDEQALSEGYDYFRLRSYDISPDNRLVAYALDTDGSERHTIIVKEIETDTVLPLDISNAGQSVAFSKDGKGVIYSQLNSERWHVESVNLRRIAPEAGEAADTVLFKEDDNAYFLGASHSSDGQWLIKTSGRHQNNDVELLPAYDLGAEPIVVVSKADNVMASVDTAGDSLYLLTNDSHVNFRLARATLNDAETPVGDKSQWQTLVEGRDSHYLMGMQTFSDFIVLSLRENGQDRIQLMEHDGTLRQQVEFSESVYTAEIDHNPEFDQQHVRLYYESMITPETIYDFSLETTELVERKKQHIPSGYDKSNYRTERLMAPARDGVQVPISIVYHKDFEKNGKSPLSLYAYGAYGSGLSPTFKTERLSLLDRGFAFAIAHVRGGDEMGYQWYLDGKMDKRKNAFTDFIDVADYLIEQGYTGKGNISISGRSAGGMMMGAMTIQAPDYWRSVNLGVPFVDVLNTMLDASLPLTPPEWQEWGNPIENKSEFEYILSYSPYDQITARDYPPMLVTGGLNDPRVTYWEPAKWTARMRATKTDNNLLVMRMNMGAGHFANSGRYGKLRDSAEEYAFELLAHGIEH
ncbi:S9 family peptidase [Alteromonas oceanisediminis]|uniref:S9 family peptidase n=1 Tax=Alteromonas oceanisediminis TaxID=2836180 RepID=UPI002023AB2B|nr:S9 family peptidase [Alteromonas oceanisediminis]